MVKYRIYTGGAMNYSIISRNRGKLMGIATLWIAVFHSTMWITNRGLGFLKVNGYGGVDIFLFLSAFGLYYSYSKDSDKKNFYLKRARRVLPAIIPVMFLSSLISGYSLPKLVAVVLNVDFWISGNLVLWYFPALLVLYLVTPFFLDRFIGHEKKWLVLGLAFGILIGLLTLNDVRLIFYSRIPVFVTGFYFAYLAKGEVKISTLMKMVLAVTCLAGFVLLYFCYHRYGGYMWSYGLYWYPFILITPGMLVYLSIFLELVSGISLFGLLGKLGRYSMEFYLFNEMVIGFIDDFRLPYDDYAIGRNILAMAITLVIAVLYKIMIDRIKDRIGK